jgi:hypothetical protein
MIWDPVPGVYDHRGLDCRTCGVNVPHFRLRGELMRFVCVRCALELTAKIVATEEKQKCKNQK